MERDQKLLIGLIAIIFLVVAGIVSYLLITNKKSENDGTRFKTEYESYNGSKEENNGEEYLELSVDEDNVFVYKTDAEIIDVLENGTGVIYFGSAKCSNCRSMVNVLNEAAKEAELKEIYYVDISTIRDSYEVMEATAVKISNGSDSYYKILNILDDYLTEYFIEDGEESYNTGVKRLYAPTVVAVKDGGVTSFYEGTFEGVKDNSDLSDNQKETLKEIYLELIDTINSDVCTSKDC